MSRLIRSPAEAMTSPPIRNIGVISVMPQRMPHVSPTVAMSGSVIRPASTNTEPIENPIERARGGMAIDRAARTPGSTKARHALITTLAATASHDPRRPGEHERGHRDHEDRPRPAARTRAAGRWANSFMPRRAPMTSPTSCDGPSTSPTTQPRADSSSPKTSR